MMLELTLDEYELVQLGLGSLMQDRRFSANRQWEAQQVGKKLHLQAKEQDNGRS
jgi:hypothetical protein